MGTPRTTALYAALLALIFLFLSVRVALARWRRAEYRGERDAAIARQVRVHANFSENVPLALILMAFADLLGASALFLHGLGSLLIGARLLHAYGVSREPEPIWFRVIGYTLTCGVIGSAALAILYFSVT